MCETLYSFDSDGIFFCRSRNWSISRGLTLMRADDVALAQDLHREFLAQAVAIAGVVDALRGERRRQIGERDLVLLGDVAQRVVQRFVGHLDAGAFGALHLQFLQHQAVEHLLAQDVLRRQLELLRAQALGDDEHLLVELARQHDAFVDGGGDAVEQHAGAASLAGLGEGGGGGDDTPARTGSRAKMLLKSCSCFSPDRKFPASILELRVPGKRRRVPTLASPFSSSCT